jgi:histone H3/H4
LESINIALIADDLGISNLAPEAAELLVKDAEYKLREIVEAAQKFSRRAYRKTLSTIDI